jgi:hypothetical protein
VKCEGVEWLVDDVTPHGNWEFVLSEYVMSKAVWCNLIAQYPMLIFLLIVLFLWKSFVSCVFLYSSMIHPCIILRGACDGAWTELFRFIKILVVYRVYNWWKWFLENIWWVQGNLNLPLVMYCGVCPSPCMCDEVVPSTCSFSELIGWSNTFAFGH